MTEFQNYMGPRKRIEVFDVWNGWNVWNDWNDWNVWNDWNDWNRLFQSLSIRLAFPCKIDSLSASEQFKA